MNKDNITKTEEIFLDLGRKLCSIIGWREAIGHIYALLYIENGAMSLDDIAQKTNLSKSNVWEIIQQLLRLGAVNKIWRTGNRKDYYVAERKFDSILRRGLLPLLKSKAIFLDSYLDNAEKELTAVNQGLGAGDNTQTYYENILADIVRQKEKLESFLDILGSLK